MIAVLTHFGLAVVLSFIGSIPFGTINVATAETAIRQGMRAAVWVALGAAIIEFFQAVLSLRFSEMLLDYPVVETSLTWASIPILIALGIYFLKKKPGPVKVRRTRAQGFIKGIIVSTLNVLAIPYWIFYGSYFSSIDVINLESNTCIMIFGGGVLIGTFLILLVYARLGVYAGARSQRIRRYIGPVVATILFVLAAVQILRLLL